MLTGVVLAQGGNPGKQRMMEGSRYEEPMYGSGWGYGYGMMGPVCGPMQQGWGMGYYMGPGMMGPCWGMSGHGCGMSGPGWSMAGPGYELGYGQAFGSVCFGVHASPEMKEFLNETKALRRELHMKIFDYWEAVSDEDISDEALKKMEDEIQDLIKKIREKAPWRMPFME